MYRAIVLLSCLLPLSTALLETFRNLDLPADTTSWDYLHTQDPYFKRTGSYFNGVLKVWRNPNTKDNSISDKCISNNEAGAQYYHSVAWLGPNLDSTYDSSSRDHNNIQAWLVGMPTETFPDKTLPTFIPASTEWAEWTPDFPTDIKDKVKKTAESTKMRNFPFQIDTSVYGWNMESDSDTPYQVVDVTGQIGTTVSKNTASYNAYNDRYYSSNDDCYYGDEPACTTTTTSTASAATSVPTSYKYDLNWYYSPIPSGIQQNLASLVALNDNAGNAFDQTTPFANHIYYAPSCSDSQGGRLLVGHGQRSIGSSTKNSAYPSLSSSDGNSYDQYYFIRAAISYDGKNFTILGTNRYYFNRTASADIFNTITKDAPSEWYPSPIDHEPEAERTADKYVDIIWQFEGRLDEEESTNRLEVTYDSKTYTSSKGYYRWESENDRGLEATDKVAVVNGSENGESEKSGVGQVVAERWYVGLGVVAVVFIGWL